MKKSKKILIAAVIVVLLLSLAVFGVTQLLPSNNAVTPTEEPQTIAPRPTVTDATTTEVASPSQSEQTSTPTEGPTDTPTPSEMPTEAPTGIVTDAPVTTKEPTPAPTPTPTPKPTATPKPTPTPTQEGSDCLAYELSDDGTYYICTGFDGFVYPKPSKIVIPAYYNNKPVKALGDGNLSDYSGSIKEIIISDGIENIGRLFFQCAGVKSITLPSSIKSIHGWAFRKCTSLEKIYISTKGWYQVDYTNHIVEKSCDFSDPTTAANILRSGYDGRFYVR